MTSTKTPKGVEQTDLELGAAHDQLVTSTKTPKGVEQAIARTETSRAIQ